MEVNRMTKRTSREKPKAPPQVEAMGYTAGVRVKCDIDMGHVRPGTTGTVTDPVPQAGAAVVRFDGATHDTLVPLTQLQVIGYAAGDRVKCTINIGPVLAGTAGTVKESYPQADASAVRFDGTSAETLVPNDYLKPA
jgi:hypothetical protein